MAPKSVAFLLADLGVTNSHSLTALLQRQPQRRGQFKTLKYRPDSPDTVGSIEDVRMFCDRRFRWYAHEHRHSRIGQYTPADVHDGLKPAHTVRPERGAGSDQPPGPGPVDHGEAIG